jgi:hypothetical protein
MLLPVPPQTTPRHNIFTAVQQLPAVASLSRTCRSVSRCFCCSAAAASCCSNASRSAMVCSMQWQQQQQQQYAVQGKCRQIQQCQLLQWLPNYARDRLPHKEHELQLAAATATARTLPLAAVLLLAATACTWCQPADPCSAARGAQLLSFKPALLLLLEQRPQSPGSKET